MTTYNTQMIEAVVAQMRAAVESKRILNAEAMRGIRREFSRQLADAPPRFLYRLAVRLLKEGDFCYRFFGYEMISVRTDALAILGEKELVQLGKGLSDWYGTDTFGGYVSGRVWLAGQIDDNVIVKWAKSPDLWWRRAALTSTVPLNQRSKGAKGDTARTLKICRMLVDDREDMVIKALSWALREVVWHDPDSIRAFLAEYEDRLAARVKREVRHKLETGLKNPRRHA